MTEQPKASLSPRKLPQQARSARLVEDILTAATQVLMKEGAHRFTTARVAELAGVSIGSLYQYFPSKRAILFRLQTNEWERTGKLLRETLTDSATPPLERLRRMIQLFFWTEYEEAGLRVALGDAVPLYRDAREMAENRISDKRVVQNFMQEALPNSSGPERDRAADIILMTMQAIGERVSEERRDAAEIEACARATADMAFAYLESLAARSAG